MVCSFVWFCDVPLYVPFSLFKMQYFSVQYRHLVMKAYLPNIEVFQVFMAVVVQMMVVFWVIKCSIFKVYVIKKKVAQFGGTSEHLFSIKCRNLTATIIFVYCLGFQTFLYPLDVFIISNICVHIRGTLWCCWLRHRATSRKVACSILDNVVVMSQT